MAPKMIETRNIHPPKFDVKPLMSLSEVGKAIAFSSEYDRSLLNNFKKDSNVEISDLAVKSLTEDQNNKIITSRHGEPTDFDKEPQMARVAIAKATRKRT